MSDIKSALNVLCTNHNVRNALIITKDGMVVESNMDKDGKADILAAFMSQIALTIKSFLVSFGHTDFTRYMIQSNQGRVVLVDLGKSVLIALTELDIEQEKVNVALFQAANEIKKTGRLDT